VTPIRGEESPRGECDIADIAADMVAPEVKTSSTMTTLPKDPVREAIPSSKESAPATLVDLSRIDNEL